MSELLPARRFHQVHSGVLRLAVPAMLLVAVLSSCDSQTLGPSDPGIDNTPTEIRLSGSRSILDRGDTARITATLVNRSGSSVAGSSSALAAPVTWKTSDPSIASITRSGLVLAHRQGQVKVTASTGTLLTESTLNVTSSGKRFTIAPQVDTLHAIGHTLQLSVTALNPNGREIPNPSVTWSTLDPVVASVNTSGIVRAIGAGTALIVASGHGMSDTATVVVKVDSPPPPIVAAVTVNPDEVTAELNSTVRFDAVAVDGSGQPLSDVDLTWSSSDTNVATVDNSGTVTTKNAGAVTVRATAEGKSGTATLVVPMPSPAAVAEVTLSPATATAPVGTTVQFSATPRDADGQPIADLGVVWSSSNTMLASVDGSGRVTTKADGSVKIRAMADGVIGEASLTIGSTAPPKAASVTVSPAAVAVEAGSTTQLSASVFDSDGKAMATTLIWSSTNATVATVDGTGLVTGKAAGTVTIRATAGDVVGESAVTVLDGTVAPTDPTPPTSDPTEPGGDSGTPPATGDWDRVLSNETLKGDILVPVGERWLVGANVKVEGNLRTDGGTIAMRAGSSLTFIGADPEKYVGGGMRYESKFANDYGLWVGGTGLLDIACTPKTSWNRTGSDPTWKSTDEYWISPTALNDFTPRRWSPGQSVPRAHARVPAAEVMNVTRDCEITGPAHIHVSSSRPARIEYVTLRGMGITRSDGATTGRYALHLHMQGEGSRGTVIRGVASIDAGGRVFVPHTSHGVTFIDNVCVNSLADCFWWDEGDFTNDVLVDRLAVSGVHMPREITGRTNSPDGISLGAGVNMTMTNSVVSGLRGAHRTQRGFTWPTSAADRHEPVVWEVFDNNVAHNIDGSGMRFWTNRRDPHDIHNFIAYRNAGVDGRGIENGAYANTVRYFDILLIDNFIEHRSSSSTRNWTGGDNRGSIYERVEVRNSVGPALRAGPFNLHGSGYTEFIDCVLVPGSGFKVMEIHGGSDGLTNPARFSFTRCNIKPEDISFSPEALASSGAEGSHIIIRNADGSAWDITVKDKKVHVTKK
jgi:uncharacterized protein YjdB